jgi:hypothetical protein
VVIDAHSPVVWGSASAEPGAPDPERKLELVDLSSVNLVDPSTTETSEADAEGDARSRQLSETAIEMVRDLPELRGLRRGGHLARVVPGPDLCAFARSFASIYVLIVVHSGSFDEARTERAVDDALPRIERLVLALPPLDPKPAPIAGVISLRRGRRR